MSTETHRTQEEKRAVSNPLEKIKTDDLVARATVLKDLVNQVEKLLDTHRAELATRMPRGSKLTGRNPMDTDQSLGTVSWSDPEKKAYITDSAAFEKWCRATYPDEVEVWTEFGPAEEVAAVLAEHAPHLIIAHSSVPAQVKEKALMRAVDQDVPGTTCSLPRSVVSVRPSPNARAVTREMFAASPVLRELEA